MGRTRKRNDVHSDAALLVRTPALRAVIDRAGPVNAATRALIILGAHAAGLELGGCVREIALLLAENLGPGVCAALHRL